MPPWMAWPDARADTQAGALTAGEQRCAVIASGAVPN